MAHREDREQTRHKTVPTSADYLKEPLDHLFTSLDDESQSQSKTLDLIQVYTVLSDRLKRFITSCDATKRLDASGLDYLQDHAGELVRCLLRDVGLAFVDPPPLDAFRRHNQGKAAPSAGPAMDAQMKQPKRVAAICHHAIQLTSCIFAFPALSSVFSSAYDVQICECMRPNSRTQAPICTGCSISCSKSCVPTSYRRSTRRRRVVYQCGACQPNCLRRRFCKMSRASW